MKANTTIEPPQRITVEAEENVRCSKNDYMTHRNTLIEEAAMDKNLIATQISF